MKYSIAKFTLYLFFIGAIFQGFIWRIQAQSALDGFAPNPNNQVRQIVVQPDGKILICGDFTSVAGVTRNRIARLNADGSLDVLFNPNASSSVYAMALQPDGKILVGGLFTNIGGQTRNYLARLSNDTPVLQIFAITQNSISWTNDGGSVQFTHAIFEQSTDNGTTWTTLGEGSPNLVNANKNNALLAPQSSGFTLNGLNLSTGQNVLIRAEGFYQGGGFNGSETMQESVKNVFLVAPTAASVSIGGRVFTSDGRGLRNAFVTLTDTNGNSRTSVTGSFGYYSFTDVEVGQTYIVSVRSKRFQFNSQVVNVTDELTDLDFRAF